MLVEPNNLYVCPAAQFHASLAGMVSDTKAEFPDMPETEARERALYGLLWVLVPAGWA